MNDPCKLPLVAVLFLATEIGRYFHQHARTEAGQPSVPPDALRELADRLGLPAVILTPHAHCVAGLIEASRLELCNPHALGIE